jgi:bifunctional non-homologous end joining protein LigD
MPYLVDRPQVLHRHVDGHSGKEFFQRVSRATPSWLKMTEITLDDGRKRDSHLCQDWPTLLWLANFGCIDPFRECLRPAARRRSADRLDPGFPSLAA